MLQFEMNETLIALLRSEQDSNCSHRKVPDRCSKFPFAKHKQEKYSSLGDDKGKNMVEAVNKNTEVSKGPRL